MPNAYSKNDFFYTSAEENGYMPSIKKCENMEIYEKFWDISCNDTNFVNNSNKCIEKELCINKETVKLTNEIESRNSGSIRKHENSKTVFNNSFLTTINLGVGVLILGLLIYNARKST
jgi:hypothetical protein